MFFALGSPFWRSFNHGHTFFYKICPEKNARNPKKVFLKAIESVSEEFAEGTRHIPQVTTGIKLIKINAIDMTWKGWNHQTLMRR